MEKLNNKIKNGRSEKIDDAQMVGNYAYDSTVDKLRRLTCDTNGALHVDVHGGSAGSGDLKCRTDIADPSTSTFVKCNADGTLEMTAELSSAGLATSANQDTVINATVRDINNTGSIGDGSSNATSVALGYDRSGGKARSVLVNSAGELMVNLGSATTQNVNCLGNEEGDGSGAVKHLHLDGSGNVQTNVVNTVNIAPANSVNSHITDDPANSVACGMKARTTIGTATTEQFLLCDSDGHLQVDVLSGGGSSSSTQTSESKSIPHNSLEIIGDNTNDYIDTNGGNKFVIVVQSASSAGGTQILIEWSDVTSFSAGNVFACNGFVAGVVDATPRTFAGTSRLDSSSLTNQAIFQFDLIPARYARITVLQSSGGSITIVGKSYLSP